jgi:hypothetical protein
MRIYEQRRARGISERVKQHKEELYNAYYFLNTFTVIKTESESDVAGSRP